MTKDNWRLAFELLGISAVIISLALVAVEIQQNTEMTRAQTRDSITQKQVDWFLSIGTDEFASDVLRRGGGGELDPSSSEYTAYLLIQQANLRNWENELYQFRQGLFEENEFAARRQMWENVITSTPSLVEMWNRNKSSYSIDFQEELDSLIANGISF